MTDAVLSIRALTVDFVVGEEKKRIIKNISLKVCDYGRNRQR